MPTSTRPAADFTPKQLRFHSILGFTIRADFAGGELSSDFGAVVLGAVDRRIGLIDRLTDAITDTRDARYITHALRDLLKQRVFQIASGYEDGNDANTLRNDPLFKLATGRAPLDTDNQLACGATHSRLEGSLFGLDPAIGRVRVCILSRAWLLMAVWRRSSSSDKNRHAGSKRLALHDLKYARGLVQSPDLELSWLFGFMA